MLSAAVLDSVLKNAANVLVVDGGLATELERRGECISDALWSARLLVDRPELLEEVHLDYMLSGASFVLTASYQASVAGLCTLKHLSEEEAVKTIASSVTLVKQARSRFAAETSSQRPLWIGGSIGPYGACLADGSEYRGDYASIDRFSEVVTSFHRPRLAALLSAQPDFLAFETLPLVDEALLLLSLLDEVSSDSPLLCWISFCCRDGESIADGSPFADAVRAVAAHPRVFAVGCNCVAPKHVASLIAKARQVTNKPIVVYPNLGEIFDATRHCWIPDSETDASSSSSSSSSPSSSSSTERFVELARTWASQGAPLLVGGCCRTTPSVIAALARQFPNPQEQTT